MHKRLQRGLLALLLVGAIALAFTYRDQLDVETLEAWVASAGLAGPLLFMALYVIATVLYRARPAGRRGFSASHDQ